MTKVEFRLLFEIFSFKAPFGRLSNSFRWSTDGDVAKVAVGKLLSKQEKVLLMNLQIHV